MRLAVNSQPRTPQQMTALYRSVISGIAALPGVLAVGGTSQLPLSHAESITLFRVDGYPNRPNQTAAARPTGGDYLRAMQRRLVAGRLLSDAEIPAQPSPVPPTVPAQ